MMIDKKKFISNSILIIILLIVIVYIFKDIDWKGKSAGLVLGFLVIGMISIYNIVKDARIISMNKSYWCFQLIFMCIAPLCQYLSEYYPWDVHLDKSDVEIALCLTILWNCMYMLFYCRSKMHIKIGRFDNKMQNYLTRIRNYSDFSLLVVFAFTVFAFANLVAMVGFSNLFFRSENTLYIGNSTISFVIRQFLTALPAMTCVLFVFVNKQKNSFILKVGILIALFFSVCSNFPTSTTRYWMGTIFIGIAYSLFIYRKKSRIVDYGIIFGLLVVFPFFYAFKFETMTIVDLLEGNINFSQITESFNTVDFDAFSLVVRAVRYVHENGITWGQQLINIIFFFVPRSIWTSKPIVTNVLIASSQKQSFTNVSCPLVSEGYVNFGLVGVMIYCFFYAKVNRYLDDVFWIESQDNILNIINIIYPFLTVITIYINRGPLQPSFIQTVSLCLPLIFITFFEKIKFNKRAEK